MDRRRHRNPPTRPLVLIVAGHEDTRAMYACALATAFDVVAIEDDSDAFRRAWEMHPDIIVADLPLPGEGWPLLDRLKESARTRDIPVVAMSAYAQPSVGERVEREGLAAFFPLPCLPDELALGLRRVLDRNVHVHAGE
jgi:two-component system cell cycle response regulator/two-component system cell cycle response regulator DivK